MSLNFKALPAGLTPILASARDGSAWLLRAGYAVFRQIKTAGLDYRAMSLVYTSLLALIPLLAVCFSMLKAFGADAYLEPMLLELLKPLRGNTESVAETLFESVKRLDVGVLGSVGLLSLLYTSVSLLDKIEDSFNHIWRKQARVARSLRSCQACTSSGRSPGRFMRAASQGSRGVSRMCSSVGTGPRRCRRSGCTGKRAPAARPGPGCGCSSRAPAPGPG